MRTTRPARLLTIVLLIAPGACIHISPVADMREGITSSTLAGSDPKTATEQFIFDDNRVFVSVRFIRPDGTEREALAFVNMGSGSFVLSNKLYRELAPGPAQPLRMKFGGMEIAIDGGQVLPESIANNLTIGLNPFGKRPTASEAARAPGGDLARFSAPLPVEAVLPPGLLQHFMVVFDYGAKTMTLAAPGAIVPQGVAVPIRLNTRTGFAIVEAQIEGAPFPLVIDDGGSYSVIRGQTSWADKHPGWLHSIGGVGEANYAMISPLPEADARVWKIARVALGNLELKEWGAVELGGPGWLDGFIGGLFWDRIYSQKAGEQVEGWIGGNVLKTFRLTLDYPDRMSYWLEETPLDTDDLDQVGIVLIRSGSVTRVGALAQKNGANTVGGIQPGDEIIRIDNLDAAKASRGQLLAALHGKPGEIRTLELNREGKKFAVRASVTAF